MASYRGGIPVSIMVHDRYPDTKEVHPGDDVLSQVLNNSKVVNVKPLSLNLRLIDP